LWQSGVVPSGEDPEAHELELGMVALQSLYDEWLSNGMFGKLTDRYETSDYTAEEGQRIIAPAGVTITLPETIYDYPDGEDRAPRDLSVIERVVAGVRETWLFDRTGWVSLTDLEAGDEAPLASRGVYGLAAALGVSGGFLSAFGGDPKPTTAMLASRFLTGLSLKWGTTHDRSGADYF
jgi:hypothetical protein